MTFPARTTIDTIGNYEPASYWWEVRLEVLNEIPEDENLRRQWNALVDSTESPQVFYTYEWALAVQRAYGRLLRPLIFLAYDCDGSLIGAAALSTGAENKASFLGATTGDYCDFLSRSGDRAEFVRQVLNVLSEQGISDIALTNLPADSASNEALKRAASHSEYLSFSRTAYVCSQVVFQAPEGDERKEPVLPRRKAVRRFLSALSREGPVRLEHASTWETVEPLLPRFFQAHVSRFLYAGRVSNTASPERQNFLIELARLLSRSGSLVFSRLVSGETALAWNYGFRFHGTWFWYQPTFDSTVEKYSPGFCMLAKLIEDAAQDSSVLAVDMGLGAEEYKNRFANQTRMTLHVTLQKSAAAHVRTVTRYHAATIIQRFPRVEAAMRSLAGRIQTPEKKSLCRTVTRRFSSMHRPLFQLWSRRQMVFYEWHKAMVSVVDEGRLQPLDFDSLAIATTEYFDDHETIAYLLRSAHRLREGNSKGFVLFDAGGKPVHFAWLGRFDESSQGLNSTISAAQSDSALLADCWTPASLRRQGHLQTAVELIAKDLNSKGHQLWACGEPRNPWVATLQSIGFRRRFSRLEIHFLWRQRVSWNYDLTSKPPVSQSRACAS